LRGIRAHPEYRHQQELLAQLTRVVDALAKRCDELDRRLRILLDQVEDSTSVLSEDLTRMTARASDARDSTKSS
jgi:uncharacterized coiled-coil protein SlyX